MRISIFATILAVLIAGCVSMGKEIKPNQVAQLKPGVTTIDDVLNRFGAPTNKTYNSDGSTRLMYNYHRSQKDPLSFVPVVGIFAGSGDEYSSLTTLVFNQNGTLREYSTDESGSSIGMGAKSGRIRSGHGGVAEAPE